LDEASITDGGSNGAGAARSPRRHEDGAVTKPLPSLPAVLFVDDRSLVPFVQLALFLRRSGYRTIRVTTAGRTFGSSLTRRIAFDRLLHLERSALADLDSILADEHLVDVHCAEPLAIDVYRALARRPGPVGATGWRHRTDLIDKRKVMPLLDALGVAHPDSVAGDTAPEEAVRRLGLPIVVKPGVGAYGEGVFVTHSAEGLKAHLATVQRDDVFLEAFVDGTPTNYCAVVGDGAERDMTYRILQRGPQPWSPSIEIACYRDNPLTDIGRRLAAALPCEGLLNVDAIRDREGRYLVHDVNVRVWGALFASKNVGFDLTSAYLCWLGDQVRASAGDGEQSVKIFPDYANAILQTDRRAEGLRVLIGQARDYRRLLGSRYVVREVLRWGRLFLLGQRTNNGADR